MTEGERPDPSSPRPTTGADALSDSELIALVRAGDSAAYEELFLRHREVAIRYARRLSDTARAEDLCAEAFTKILDLLQRGMGPEVSFRAYLLTTVRTSHLNNLRTGNREVLVPDHEPISRMVPILDDPDGRFDRGAIYRAFYQLPERWQVALWLTAVEGLSHEEASTHLDIKANAVASLTFRARAGLRQAYLSEHLLETADPTCRTVVEQLPSYLRGRLSGRRRRLVEEHLDSCSSCATAALELAEVNDTLGALLAPLALTGFSVGAATMTGHATGAAALIKGAASTLVGNAQAAGAALQGAFGAKAAAVLTVTALSVGVGAEIVHRDSRPPVGDDVPTSLETLIGPPKSSAKPSAGAAKPGPTPSDTPSTGLAPYLPTRTLSPSTATTTASATPSSTSTPTSPGPSTPAPPTAAARTMAIGAPTTENYQRNGAHWERVSLPITDAPRGTTLVVTTNRTIQVAQPITAGTGWICGLPTTNWFSGSWYASTKIVCDHNADGNGPALRFDYNVIAGAVMTAEVTPPWGYADTSLSDNLVQLLLRN